MLCTCKLLYIASLSFVCHGDGDFDTLHGLHTLGELQARYVELRDQVAARNEMIKVSALLYNPLNLMINLLVLDKDFGREPNIG
jgi:hypothetical protein